MVTLPLTNQSSPVRDAHGGAGLHHVQEVVELVLVSVRVARGEGVVDGDLAGAALVVLNWGGIVGDRFIVRC